MKQIQMNKSKNLSVNDAYDLFIRKCRVKNLSQVSIVSYENKIHPFVDYCDGGLISAVTIDTVDGFTNHLKTEHNANDVSVVSYLRSVRAFLYYCMECRYMTSFKIHLPKAQKDIKETYSNEQLEKLLDKPDMNSCTFTEFKTWVFENYMLATGNRLSTALNVHIKDIDFDSGTITLRKTKNRKQQIIPLSASLSDILREYLDIRGGNPEDYLFCNNYGEQASNRTFQTLVYRHRIKAKLLISLYFTKVKWHLIPFIYTVVEIKIIKKIPKKFLTPIFDRKYKGFRNFHKDALGRETQNVTF